MMGTMTEPLTGLVVALDEASFDDTIGTVEVLVQEGLVNLAFPVGAELATWVAIYGSRARIGVHRVRTPDEARAAIEAGASFVLADWWDEELAAACEGVAAYPSAMTPTEVRRAQASGVAGVQVVPADVLGPSFAEHLGGLGLAEASVPRGSLGAYLAGRWFTAGARAAVVDAQLLGDAQRGGDLGLLRDRCGSFVDVQKQVRASS